MRKNLLYDYSSYFVQKMINPVLRTFGGELTPSHKAISLESSLSRIASKKLDIGTVIDIGASYGKWSMVAKQYFPKSTFFLIEAQKVHEESLMNLSSRLENMEYVIAAAGDEAGWVSFDGSDPLGGVVVEDSSRHPGERTLINVPVITVDEEVQRRALLPPYLLKLDTHGYELPVLKGAEKTLEDTEILYMEVYNFKLSDESLLFHEMCSHMLEKGFRPMDICEPLFRPGDGVFWQLDIAFARIDSIHFDMEQYR